MSVTKDDLIGSWRLVRMELLDPENDKGPPPFGGKPDGVLHYLPEGRMVAILHEKDRPPIPGGRRGGTDQEWKASARSFAAYAGPFTIEGDRIVHHVEFNVYPNDVDADYVRYARIEQGVLVLETPPDPGPDQRALRLFWRRIE